MQMGLFFVSYFFFAHVIGTLGVYQHHLHGHCQPMLLSLHLFF